jgi:hypothetical protein
MQTQQPQHATISSHRCTITTHTHTHICPPTQINTNNDEGGIQRELCLGITVRKCEILHPHNKICFHTKKHVIFKNMEFFICTINIWYTKKTMEFFVHSLEHQLLCCTSYGTQPHLDGGFLVTGPPLFWNSGRAQARRAGRDPPELVWRTATCWLNVLPYLVFT